jgi:hypothetical protein
VRSTRRLIDRRLTCALAGAYLSVAGAAASCASDPDDAFDTEADGATPGVDADDSVGVDAGSERTPPRRRDAATSDAGPRPVVCTSSPCALSLTTTPGNEDGFCALLEDGTVACWGQNQRRQLGRGADATYSGSAVPERVSGLSDITFLDHTCAVDKEGSTWCWGTGPYLNNPTRLLTTEPTPVRLPLPAATMVALGVHLNPNTGAPDTGVGCVVTDGEILCWGTNRYGQVMVPPLDAGATAFYPPQPIAIPEGAAIESLVVGRATFIVRSDGTLLSWGANPPLGRVSSIVPDPYPGEVSLGGVIGVDVNEANACAVVAGIAHCWGLPFDSSSLATLQRALPEAIPTPEPLVQIATTSTLDRPPLPPFRWCGVGVSGKVYCWEANQFGQAGDGTKDYALTPVAVVGLPDPAVVVKPAVQSTCALLTSGKVYCWGRNRAGQLGNGRPYESSVVPQEVILP